MWGYPDHIDQDAARAQIKEQGDRGIVHAGQESYHHMCRFYSMKFYDHPAIQPYKWYWRIEPGISFVCPINFDPFVYMSRENKRYAYVIALQEVGSTVRSLYRVVSDYKDRMNITPSRYWNALVDRSWAPLPIRWLLRLAPYRDVNGDEWNLCHFWNNFEIADLDFFREESYRHMMDHLDNLGGFYYERWGDASISGQPTMDHKLPYTYHEDAYWAAEDEEIDLFADLVVACAEGHLSPLAAAQKITDTLASEAWKNKAEIDLKNEDRPYSNHATLVAVLIGSCISAFSPHSVVHDRLFKMIKNLVRVERRQIPNELLNRTGKVRCENYRSLDLRPVVPLWEDLRRLSFSSSCEWLAEIGGIWTGVEKCGSREQQRWRNLSYFFARLEVEGIERMGWHSPLQRLLPKYRLDEKTLGWSGYLAGQVLAAAQWFVPEGHALWVWRTCCSCEKMLKKDFRLAAAKHLSGGAPLNNHGIEQIAMEDRSGRTAEDEALVNLALSEGWLWNLENWKVWKAAFKQIEERVDDVRVHAIVRREAYKARKIMEEMEISIS
ncbi:nucleotide-diphospho-sugar transferase, partial [Aureobasidium melanogenum]